MFFARDWFENQVFLFLNKNQGLLFFDAVTWFMWDTRSVVFEVLGCFRALRNFLSSRTSSLVLLVVS